MNNNSPIPETKPEGLDYICMQAYNDMLVQRNQLQKECHAYREILEGIVNGAVHPEIAVRRISVGLKPIKDALAKYSSPKESPKVF